VIEYSTTAQIHDSQIISSTLINQFSASLSRMFIPLTSNTYGGNYPSKAGLKGLPGGVAGSGFPDITFSGGINTPVSWLGTNSHAYNEAQNTFDVQDNVLWTKGKHNLTFGFQWQSLQDNENTPLTGTQAGFTFSNAETENFSNNTAVANTGLAYAGFLLGAVDSSAVTQNAVAETGGRYKTYAFYVQDDYKVSKHLTVNLGLRWNIWSTFTEVNNVMSFFNPTMPNPAAGNIPGALEFAGSGTDSCHCSTPVKQHNVNPGPRVGLAYQLGEKTVIRASYSIFYSHAGGVGGRTNGRQGLSQLGFNNNGSLSSAVTGQPAYNWNSGYPGYPLNPPFFYPSFGIGYITAAAAASLPYPAGPTTAQTITYGDPNFGGKAPYYENWSFNIQRSLTPNWMLSLAYSASAGHWLPGAAVAGPMTNQIPVRYLPLGSLLTSTLSASTLAQAQAIFPNIAIPFPNFTGTIGQAVKPFPQYNGISDPWLDIGNSTYNALQISVNHRFAAGLSVMFNYAYSKELDDLVGVRDPNKDFLEKGPGTIDHPSVASATFVYQLPFGKGHKLSAGVLNPVVGHWQISGLFTYQGGAPLSITGTCTGGGIIDASCYPNYATGFSGSVWQNGTIGSGGANVSSTVYLNKAAFVDPAAYTVGNITRAAPYGLFAPHNADVDLSVRREFPIRERIRLLFQADAFNVNNAVHFAAPGLGIDSSTFGIVSSMANSPRKLQFGARLSF
jgi:outer membrane receptor protein involved in Fe transport